MKYSEHPLLSQQLRDHHEQAWLDIACPGDFYSAADRVEMVRVAREAVDCFLCQQRKNALSPNSIEGTHDGPGELEDVVVDVIHRIKTDPGRLTKTWFDIVTDEISPQQYVEIVSVVTTSVIIDTLHNALGYGIPELPPPRRGRLRGEYNEDAVDAGAWVPVQDAGNNPTDTGLPHIPNIVRALGLVPSAVDLFFHTFRPHYALKEIPLTISQAQAELVASRVSAINECFY